MTKTKLRLTLIAGAFAVILIPTEASAWYCRADSPSAYGWGQNYSRRAAIRRALAECAVRTPRWQRCRISYCN
jgi:hypothetical protein